MIVYPVGSAVKLLICSSLCLSFQMRVWTQGSAQHKAWIVGMSSLEQNNKINFAWKPVPGHLACKTCSWNPCSGTYCNYSTNLFLEPLLGNLFLETLLENLFLATLLGNLFLEPLLGNLFLVTLLGKPCLVTSLGNLFLETGNLFLETCPWEPIPKTLLGNLSWKPVLGNLA